MRKTKIVCTLGPSSQNEREIEKMLKSGMNIVRLNFSHGSHELHEKNIKLFRKVRDRLGLPAAVLLDTKGPEIRIGDFKNGSVTLSRGDIFRFSTEAVEGNEKQVYNYIAMNDDVYMYTGVTSVSSDQSNIGFLLSNQRTKETVYYAAPGAVETSAQSSARGVVQDLGYTATFPLLLNVAGEPTYFMSLKDSSQLVKQYAMVNVAQYQIVATGVTVAECESNYLKLLTQSGITTEEELPQTEVSGIVGEIRTMVVEGTTYFCIQLKSADVFYAISASKYPEVVTLNVGERVTIQHEMPVEGEAARLLDGYSITIG